MNSHYSLKVISRGGNTAVEIYRFDGETTQKLSEIKPDKFMASCILLRDAVVNSFNEFIDYNFFIWNKKYIFFQDPAEISALTMLQPDKEYWLDNDWGAKVALYAVVISGLANSDRIETVANKIRTADPTEAAWWLGLIKRGNPRMLKGFRIIVGAID